MANDNQKNKENQNLKRETLSSELLIRMLIDYSLWNYERNNKAML